MANTVLGIQLFQIVKLTHANMKARYRKTWMGFFWVILNPLALYGTQSYIFGTVLKIKFTGYGLFLLAGLLPWIFIVQTIEMTASSIINHSRNIKSYAISPLVYVISQTADNFFNFVIAFSLVLIPSVIFFGFDKLTLLLLPLAIFSLVLFVTSFAIIIATLQVILRDTHYLTSFLLTVGYFITPVFYPKEFVPVEFQWAVTWNPLFQVISPFQKILGGAELSGVMNALILSYLVAGIGLIIARFLWIKLKPEIYLKL